MLEIYKTDKINQHIFWLISYLSSLEYWIREKKENLEIGYARVDWYRRKANNEYKKIEEIRNY